MTRGPNVAFRRCRGGGRWSGPEGARDTPARHAEGCRRRGLDSSTMSTHAAPRPDQNFAHLHVHTEYSMLDGAARIGDLFGEAARMGMPALATTDHGYVFGAYEFWKKAQGTGVKPIIGVEAYVTPGTHRTDKTRVKWGDERSSPGDDVSGSGAYTHMTLLARDNTGLHNLFRMDSQASLDQVYAKWPRVDRELLSQYGQGLIATTGCPSGEVQTRLRL